MTRSNALRAAFAAVPVALFALTPAAHAQTNLAFFNFNDGTTQAALFSADGGVFQTQSNITIDPTFAAANITSFGGTGTVNATPPGSTTASIAGQALALQGGNGITTTNGVTTGGNNGKYVQFNTTTTGYQNIVFSFATQRSNTGFNNNTFSYSTDGVNFTTLGPAYTPTTDSFGTAPVSFNLTTATTLNNASNVYFRLTLNGATNANANNRIDNVQINGTAITANVTAPEPATLALMSFGLVGGMVARRRRNK